MKDDKMLLDGAFARQIVAREELSIAKADAQAASEQLEQLETRFSSMLCNIINIDECRHCHEKFNWSLERIYFNKWNGMQLRCADCRTKHPV